MRVYLLGLGSDLKSITFTFIRCFEINFGNSIDLGPDWIRIHHILLDPDIINPSLRHWLIQDELQKLC